MSVSMYRDLFKAVLCFFLLACSVGCKADDVGYYDAQKWLESTDSENTRRMLTALFDMKHKLERASQVEARLLISDDEDVNAFATEIKGEKLIVLNVGLIDAFEADRDAVAAAYAHELGHHAKQHIQKGESTSKTLGVLGALVGAVIDYKLGAKGVGGHLGRDGADFAASLLDRKFSRDQEREADEVSVGWLLASGYNPEGGVRMHRKLLEESGNAQFSMMSTHPTSEERIANLEKLIHADARSTDLRTHAPAPLYVAVEEKDEAPDLAQAGGQPLEAPEAALIAPAEGLSFDNYCRLSNELAYTQDAPATYKKYGTSPATYTRVNAAMIGRMREDRSGRLGAYYSAHFLAASQGPYAKWAKDAANAYVTGQALHESPPIPLEQWAEIGVQLERLGTRASNPAALDEVLKPYKLTRYEWILIQNWWGKQLANQSRHDTRFLQSYMQARADAEARIGSKH